MPFYGDDEEIDRRLDSCALKVFGLLVFLISAFTYSMLAIGGLESRLVYPYLELDAEIQRLDLSPDMFVAVSSEHIGPYICFLQCEVYSSRVDYLASDRLSFETACRALDEAFRLTYGEAERFDTSGISGLNRCSVGARDRSRSISVLINATVVDRGATYGSDHRLKVYIEACRN